MVFGKSLSAASGHGTGAGDGDRVTVTGSGFIPLEPWTADVGATAGAAAGDAMAVESASGGLIAPRADETLDQFTKRRTVELNEMTRQRPHDEVCCTLWRAWTQQQRWRCGCWMSCGRWRRRCWQTVWLELARYQDTTLASSSANRMKHRATAVLDKQLAVYERALVTCPDSIRLYLAMLRAADELKPPNEVRM